MHLENGVVRLDGVSREVFLSDVHFPSHDHKAWALTLKLLKYVEPDLLWLGGDITDCKPLGRWAKKPEQVLKFQNDVDVTRRELRVLRKLLPNTQIFWQIGNHEEWLLKYLWSKAPELAGLDALSFENLFGLGELDITFLGSYLASRVGKLYHIHGHQSGGGSVNPARNKLMKVHDNVIFGHHHKHQIEFQRDLSGSVRGGFANGCLRSLSPEFDPFNDWTQGVSLVQYTKHGTFHVDSLVYFAGRKPSSLACVVEGNYLETKVIA